MEVPAAGLHVKREMACTVGLFQTIAYKMARDISTTGAARPDPVAGPLPYERNSDGAVEPVVPLSSYGRRRL